jgi:hypothetical protein
MGFEAEGQPWMPGRPLCHSGAHEAAQPRSANPESRHVWRGLKTPMLGFRVRVRQVPATPRNDECGAAEHHPNIFSYSRLTISLQGLLSPSSSLDERGERDRHVRGAGCGGRRRCGVTRFMGNVCLRAGRFCASTATGKETADLEMERSLDSVTDDQIETRPA